MKNHPGLFHSLTVRHLFVGVIVLLFFGGLAGGAPAVTGESFVAAETSLDPLFLLGEEGEGEEPFFSITGDLNPGEQIAPSFPLFNGTRAFNFSLALDTGSGPLALTIENGSGTIVWQGAETAGETIWGNGTFTIGNNDILLRNDGPDLASFTLHFYDIPVAPFAWEGLAAAAGINSHIRVNFPTASLYTFDLAVNPGGWYEFVLDEEYLQKTVETPTSVTYFVPAGTHDLRIRQDPAGGPLDWGVSISAAGASSDALPYAKSGTAMLEEWLPIHLASASQLNLSLALTGGPADTVELEVYSPQGLVETQTIQAGESIWTTFDLPAGTSRLHLTAPAGMVDYVLTLDALPVPSTSWAGVSAPAGLHSHLRLQFPEDALYQFNLQVHGGRYQFLLDDQYIQKTAETSTTVTFYVPAGIHDLTLIQDSGAGADWQIDISQEAPGGNTLPYGQSGGNLGGAANDFTEAWLPVHLAAEVLVNMHLRTTGLITSSMAVEVYYPGSSTPDFVLDSALGSEQVWANFTVPAGTSRLHLFTGSNNTSMSYDLALAAIPDDEASWNGVTLANGLHSAYMMNMTTTGIYQFGVEASQGYVNLTIDDMPLGPEGFANTFQTTLAAGTHIIQAVQDPAFPVAEWSATVLPVPAGASFFTFTGTIDPGVMVVPEYALPTGQTRDFNFEFTINGGEPVNLTMRNGNGEVIWSDGGYDDEIVWGSGTLTGGTNTMTLSNNGTDPAEVTLTLFDIPDAAHGWAGFGQAVGANSHIRLNFPASGLYTFDFGLSSGRYQFLLDTGYLQKTVEGNQAAGFFVPAGVHDLTIIQDTAAAMTQWQVAISDVTADFDTLPYAKESSGLGGPANDFSEEWLPISLESATPVNLALTAIGDGADVLHLEILNGGEGPIVSDAFIGGETGWLTFDLPAGTSLLHLMADGGNSAPMGYALTVNALPDAPHSWSGLAAPDGLNSHIRLTFPEDGLYSFDLAASAGRFQFHLDEEYLQKTVESTATVTHFVPAGTHNLTIVQDSQSGAEWQLDVSAAGDPFDTLPFIHSGGELGGAGNDFEREWLPVNLTGSTQVNLVISLTGNISDVLQVNLFDGLSGSNQLVTLDPVFGTETVWATFDIPAGGARLQLQANGNNLAPLNYELALHALPEPPYTYSGDSLAAGLNAQIWMQTPISGLYHVEVYMPVGFTTLLIDDEPEGPIAYPGEGDGFFYEFDVPLASGVHHFRSNQSPDFPRTTYIVTTTLVQAAAPEVYAVSPSLILNDAPTPVTIAGFNFMTGAVVQIREGVNLVTLSNVVVHSAAEISVQVPAGLPAGTYDVIVTNPDSQAGELLGALTIEDPIFIHFLPAIFKQE